MNGKETNNVLRQMVNNLINCGWSKTRIARALLGNNGQGHVNHWLANDNGRVNDFGIKPLITIADQVKYDVHIVFVPKSDDPENTNIRKQLNEYNYLFVQKLSDALTQFLTKNLDETPKIIQRKTKTKLDKVLNELWDLTDLNELTNNEDTDIIDQNDLAPEEKQ